GFAFGRVVIRSPSGARAPSILVSSARAAAAAERFVVPEVVARRARVAGVHPCAIRREQPLLLLRLPAALEVPDRSVEQAPGVLGASASVYQIQEDSLSLRLPGTFREQSFHELLRFGGRGGGEAPE